MAPTLPNTQAENAFELLRRKTDHSKQTVPFNFITKTGFSELNSTTTYLLRMNKKGYRVCVCETVCVCVCVCVCVHLQTPFKKGKKKKKKKSICPPTPRKKTNNPKTNQDNCSSHQHVSTDTGERKRGEKQRGGEDRKSG